MSGDGTSPDILSIVILTGRASKEKLRDPQEFLGSDPVSGVTRGGGGGAFRPGHQAAELGGGHQIQGRDLVKFVKSCKI